MAVGRGLTVLQQDERGLHNGEALLIVTPRIFDE